MATVSRYLDFNGFRDGTTLPSETVDEIEKKYPGWLQKRLDFTCSWLNARLEKRYQVPFDLTDPPLIVVLWVTAIVTHEASQKIGFNPTSQQGDDIVKAADRARDEIKEAADSLEGLFDLPLKEGTPDASGVVHGGPLGQSQVSAYQWVDEEAQALLDTEGGPFND